MLAELRGNLDVLFVILAVAAFFGAIVMAVRGAWEAAMALALIGVIILVVT